MDDEDKQRIKVAMIFEIMGRPPEHIVEMLGRLVDEIGEEPGVVLTAKKIREPVLMKDSKEFYTTFAEVELDVKEMMYLPLLLFKYMPAHVEVIEPEMLVLSNIGWNEVLNELARRLHRYDEIARLMQAENQDLKDRLSQITGTRVITPLTLKSEVQVVQGKKAADKKIKKKSTHKKSVKKSVKKKIKKK